MTTAAMNRREFCAALGVGAATALAHPLAVSAAESAEKFRLNYIVASCMYGQMPLATILPEVRKTGAEYIEIWALRHGNQREQIEEMGHEKFIELLKQHDVKLGSFTCFKYGIFNMQDEMKVVKELGGDLVICNSGGPKNLEGAELTAAIKEFAEKLKPHVAAAEEIGVKFGVENHGFSLISSIESQCQLMDLIDSPNFGIALAPYHLPQDEQVIAGLIEKLGTRLMHFQAWEHGMGCMTKLPKEQELMQLPGRGNLNWTPILASLKKIGYSGRTEIFMHPTPRGIPILETADLVTAEINRSRSYLEGCLKSA